MKTEGRWFKPPNQPKCGCVIGPTGDSLIWVCDKHRKPRRKKPQPYFVAANDFEGCGHRHRSIRAAERCLPRIERKAGKGMYKQRYSAGKWTKTLVYLSGEVHS